VKLRRILLVAAILLALASALLAWYPPARLLALVAIGRSQVCPTAQALKSAAHLAEHQRIKDRILSGSRLLKEESGLELWDTPKGQFWIPKGNRFVLPFNLAEMEMHIYGQGETFVHPGDVVLDCGASDGDFTREALRAGASKVISIEIAPSSAECIRRNLASEIAAGKVVVYPKGVWDKEDRMTLEVDDTNFAANTVVLRPKNAHPAVEVALTTIDKIVVELGLARVDFIKMDIEGAEVRALNGARETINRFKPRMAITAEHNPNDERDIPEAIRRIRQDYRTECGPCLEHEGHIRADVLYFY
jgi:FkbM family methyltransferase